jgi:hypothetical protein
MNLFGKIKNWQLFLLVLVPMVVGMPLAPFDDQNPGGIWAIMYSIGFMILLGWFYSIGTIVYRKYSFPKKINYLFFRINVVVLFFIMVIFVLFIAKETYFHINYFYQIAFYSAVYNRLFVFSALYFTFAYCYTLYFCAKSLIHIEEQMSKTVTFVSFLTYLFLLWMFMFGVWSIQPKVNKLLSGELVVPEVKHKGSLLQSDNEYVCSNCGAEVVLGQTKCRNCGEAFENT